MSGLGTYVPHKAFDSNKKTGSPRSTPCEAHTVAPQKQLEGPRITRKGDPRSLNPHLKWLLEESNVLQVQPLHPLKHALQLFTEYERKAGALT